VAAKRECEDPLRDCDGSANEVHTCLRTADALGYIEVDGKHLDTLNRIARTLHKLL
jgi:hypothetical protein